MRLRKFSIFLLVSALFMVCLSFTTSGNFDSSGQSPAKSKTAGITIKFDGLLAVAMGDSKRVSIGVLDAHQHQPIITIHKVIGQKRTTIATINAAELRGQVVSFDLEGGQAGAISRYYSADQNQDLSDFRWTLDAENDLFQRALHLRADRFFTKLHINTGGTWMADDQAITDRPVQFVAEDGSGKVLPFKRRFSAPMMILNLERGQTLAIGGKNKVRLTSEPGARYEISITNLPPASATSIEHFGHYFDVIGTQVTAYRPVLLQAATYGPRPLVCGPLMFSRSRID
jgi:hypothetical protein